MIECDKKLKLFDVAEETEIDNDLFNDNATIDTEINSVCEEIAGQDDNADGGVTRCSIKQENDEVIQKMEPEDNSELMDSDGDSAEFKMVKVENHTESEFLVLCPLNGMDNGNSTICKQEQSEQERPGRKSFSKCHICGTHLEEDLLMDHLKTHYFNRLRCDECSTYCENMASYKKHVSANHKDMQKSWTCVVCAARFGYKPLYKTHIEQAHAKDVPATWRKKAIFCKSILQDYKYDCPYCNRKFKSEETSLSHIKTHNKKECPICGVKITPSNLKVHVSSHNSIPVVCHLCGITYKNRTSLRSHIYYTHSTRKYVCKHCNKVFKKAYDLPLHIKKEHTGQRDHTCDICGKSFYAFHNLNKHKKTTHMKLRPFQCQYCKKSFSSKHALRTHERQHTNVTPYKCVICGEGFRQNVSLKSHKKSKHNIVEVKKFPCSVCGKKFGSKWAVLSHMRVH
ncbi:hypothetical protein NQ315_011207 [Exocentrus adspersus]|uniref:C2H2-type domain-containing protein n=1 Tax=Exocentrus adspersus TaxID=1586481 RepID=A0AAV8VF40_9CUCU|nr:hypothetical protein NQ315_011207 [Exocentrus adspersus]